MSENRTPAPLSPEREAEYRARVERWESAALAAGREVDRNALRAYMAVADAEQQEIADEWARAMASADARSAEQAGEVERLRARVAELERAAVEGRAALANLAYDHDDPGTAALGALWLLRQATLGVEAQPDQAAEVLARHDAAVLDSAADQLADRHERLAGEYADRDISGDGADAVLTAWQNAEDEVRRLAAEAGEQR